MLFTANAAIFTGLSKFRTFNLSRQRLTAMQVSHSVWECPTQCDCAIPVFLTLISAGMVYRRFLCCKQILWKSP